jgi:hypothetical protein
VVLGALIGLIALGEDVGKRRVAAALESLRALS